MKTFQYSYNYRPEIYNFIMNNLILNEDKKEKQILELIKKGKTCYQIAQEVGYSERTIQSRRKSIYEKTKGYML